MLEEKDLVPAPSARLSRPTKALLLRVSIACGVRRAVVFGVKVITTDRFTTKELFESSVRTSPQILHVAGKSFSIRAREGTALSFARLTGHQQNGAFYTPLTQPTQTLG